MELVRRLQPPPQVDLTALFRDEDYEAVMQYVSPLFSEDFVAIFHGLSGDPRAGLEGLRQSWLDWLEPWESYRVEIEDLIDAGDRVLVFSRDRARRPGVAEEVELMGSAVWTVADGKVERAEFFTRRADAIAAAGLSK